jgi:hypothetical protein
MLHDAALVAETRSWLERAGKDLRAAQHALTASPALLEDALFHCQQAVEKTLKAFLTWHGRPFRKTHKSDRVRRAGRNIGRHARTAPAQGGASDRICMEISLPRRS